jgi:hypothetical protein
VAIHNEIRVGVFLKQKIFYKFRVSISDLNAYSNGAVCGSFPIINSRYMEVNFRHK